MTWQVIEPSGRTSARPHVTNDAAARLRDTTLPILVAWGADDRAFPPALAERFCDEVATVELVMIPDRRTLIYWDQPERLAELTVGVVPRPVASG